MPKDGQQTVNENLFFNKLTYVKLKYFVQPVSSLGGVGGGERFSQTLQWHLLFYNPAHLEKNTRCLKLHPVPTT